MRSLRTTLASTSSIPTWPGYMINFPKWVPDKYLQNRSKPINYNTKVTRPLKAIVIVKNHSDEDSHNSYSHVHESFIRTYPWNTLTLKTINTFQNTSSIKEWGRGYQNKQYRIEWIPDSELYLNTYNNFYIVDEMINKYQFRLFFGKR